MNNCWKLLVVALGVLSAELSSGADVSTIQSETTARIERTKSKLEQLGFKADQTVPAIIAENWQQLQANQIGWSQYEQSIRTKLEFTRQQINRNWQMLGR